LPPCCHRKGKERKKEKKKKNRKLSEFASADIRRGKTRAKTRHLLLDVFPLPEGGEEEKERNSRSTTAAQRRHQPLRVPGPETLEKRGGRERDKEGALYPVTPFPR